MTQPHPFVEQLRSEVAQAGGQLYGLAHSDGWDLDLRNGVLGEGWSTNTSGMATLYDKGDERVIVTTGSSSGDNPLLTEEEVLHLDARGLACQMQWGMPESSDSDDHDAPVDRAQMDLEMQEYDIRVAAQAKAIVERGGEQVQIRVDGEAEAFRLIENGPTWLVRRLSGSPSLIVMGCNVDPRGLELATIPDVQPYLDAAAAGLDPWPDDPEDDDPTSMFRPHSEDDPRAHAAVAGFAVALNAGDASAAAALLLPEIHERRGGIDAYVAELAQALDGTRDLTWIPMLHGYPTGADDECWFNLMEGMSGFGMGHSVQGIVRRDSDGTWLLNLDVLDPDFVAKPVAGLADPRNVLQLNELVDLPFRAFGLVGWDGPVATHGHGSEGSERNPVVHTVRLEHGVAFTEYGVQRDMVVVETALRRIDWGLVTYRLVERGRPYPDPEASRTDWRQYHADREQLEQKLHVQPREAGTLTVDGRAVDVEVLTFGDQYAALGRVDDRDVLVMAPGSGPEGVELESLADVERYIEGSVQQCKEMEAREAARVEAGEEEKSVVFTLQTVSGGEHDAVLLDFAMELLRPIAEGDAVAIASFASASVQAEYGGEEGFARAMAEALQRRPITHAGWSEQPRSTATGVGTWRLALLFEGDNPLRRTRDLELMVGGEGVRLVTDLAQLAGEPPR